MPKKKVFKTIKVEEESFLQLCFICDRLGKKKSVFMKELVTQLFDIFSDLRKGAGILFDVNGNKLVVLAYGKSNLVTGCFQSDKSDKIVDFEQKLWRF